MELIIYHNARCAKSRETLRLVQETGRPVTIIEYLKQPPSPDELDLVCTMLGLEPADLIRWKESRLKEIGLTRQDQRSRQEWLKIMSDNPILIERPIVVTDGKAVLGRPPENVQTLL